MVYSVFDIETNGLYRNVTKIHCLVFATYDDGILIRKGKLTNMYEIIGFIEGAEVLVGHNIICYDIPVLKKLLGVKVKARLIDTLALSWYLYPLRIKHGLEYWGDDLGIQKPEIKDWTNLTTHEYLHRCEKDVEINALLYHKCLSYLSRIYDGAEGVSDNLISYLSYKMECAEEQERLGCKIDRELVEKSLKELEIIREEKINNLIEFMPKNIKYKTISKPSKTHKMDGTLSAMGAKWYDLLEAYDLPMDYTEEIKLKVSEEDGNPGSSIQLKDWLFSLGWEPINFEYRPSKKGGINKVPQIYTEDGVCTSIKELYDIEPALENLDMLTLVNHRIGIFESFMKEMDDEDYVTATVGGLTNTLRFKHRKPITNLPKVSKFYGEQIRGSIIKPTEDSILCGSDMSSLEDSTKQHYMYFFDPEYVTQMRVPGFDPHIDIGLLANMITEEEVAFFKWFSKTKKEIEKGISKHEFTLEEKERYTSISNKRTISKVVNFAGVYGAGPPKIALTAGMPLEQAKLLHTTYWNRNKAVKLVAKSCIVKTVREDDVDQMWLYNPISNFWYSLRYDKDRFSTLNQGSGVFCFDLWVREVRSRGIKIMLQYHDEIAFPILKTETDDTAVKLREAIQAVNQKVKLNVPLDISVDFGDRYSDIH